MTASYVALEGTFGAVYEDGEIKGWFFYPSMECRTHEMYDSRVSHGSGLSPWEGPDQPPFWKALRESDLGNMHTEWMEDGPPCR